MSSHTSQYSQQGLSSSDVVLQTQTHRWVIPYNCEILKTLIAEKNIMAEDLQFHSSRQCQHFIKRLLLLAASDECKHSEPSDIAVLARDMIYQKHRRSDRITFNKATF